MCSAPTPAADCFVGEIRLFGGKSPPTGWAFCNGQTLSINDYQILYSLIGNIYGGDGRATFALPNLQVRLPIGFGQGKGLANNYAIGASGGTYQVTLTEDNMPAHSHEFEACLATATTDNPVDGLFADMPTPYTEYLASNVAGITRVNADADMLTSVGGGQAHLNVMPTVCVSYIIALNGLYPDFSS
jgi:microcystin-dependent protein